MIDINMETLKMVTSKILKKKVVSITYQHKKLQGGTVANVWLVVGNATTEDYLKEDFSVVLKVQKKWMRYKDNSSWRREYDLYSSNLVHYFQCNFSWAKCYHLEINQEMDEVKLWLEYLKGASSNKLSSNMLKDAAYELGKFQGKICSEIESDLKNITNITDVNYLQNFYLSFRSSDDLYQYIRSEDCKIPKHLCKMIENIDNKYKSIFNKIEKLPVVFCHRDFWVENIIVSDKKVFLIDWDTAGWGYLGEDIASLIADELAVDKIIEVYKMCVPAYYRGFSEYVNISNITDNYIFEIMVLMYGYRLVKWYMRSKCHSYKNQQIETLQKIYEISKLRE